MYSIFMGLLPTKLLPIALVVLFTFWLIQIIYRLYFHPLSTFPGPRSAAISSNWLYKVSKSGFAEDEFERLHGLYDSHAIRIGPNELHLTDPSLYQTIYGQKHEFIKHAFFYDAFNASQSLFGAVDPAFHRERKRSMNPMFSRASIFKLEPMIKKHIAKLQRKVEAGQGKTFAGHYAFRCVTLDIISEFCFGETVNAIDTSDENFRHERFVDIDHSLSFVWDVMYNPMFRALAKRIPRTLLRIISPANDRQMKDLEDAEKIYERYKTAPKHDSVVIFDCLEHLSKEVAVNEANNVLVAGTDTTAFTLLFGIAQIARDSSLKQNLMSALRDAIPDDSKELPGVNELQSIPLLNACIKESLRLGMAVKSRLPRVVPESESGLVLAVDGKRIPPGTVVGMGVYRMHTDQTIWGLDALEFNPSRWLVSNAKELEHYLVPFSRGARGCIGQNLANAELFFLFAMVFRRFDVDVSMNVDSSFTYKDHFAPLIDEPGMLMRLTRV